MINDSNSKSVAIVGAGLSGLLAAHGLRDAGWAVTIFEKGRGPGGRMATRRVEGSVFDHGAQYFTVRDPEFRELVTQWENNQLVEVWFGGEDPEGPHPRYRGVPSMTSVAKHLATGLDVRRQAQVSAVSRLEQEWNLQLADGNFFRAGHLILTAPVAQSLALLRDGGVSLPEREAHGLSQLEYHPCLVGMFILNTGKSPLPAPGCQHPQSSLIAWIADNTAKGVSTGPAALTVHGTPAFSRHHWDSPPEVALQLMREELQALGIQGIVHSNYHRWRFSQPIQVHDERCLHLPGLRLVCAGDAFGGPRVEGAALSGLAAAKALLAG